MTPFNHLACGPPAPRPDARPEPRPSVGAGAARGPRRLAEVGEVARPEAAARVCGRHFRVGGGEAKGAQRPPPLVRDRGVLGVMGAHGGAGSAGTSSGAGDGRSGPTSRRRNRDRAARPSGCGGLHCRVAAHGGATDGRTQFLGRGGAAARPVSAGGPVGAARPAMERPARGPCAASQGRRAHRDFRARLLERPQDGQRPWEVRWERDAPEARKPRLDARGGLGTCRPAGHRRGEQAGPWASRPLPTRTPLPEPLASVQLEDGPGLRTRSGALGREVQGLSHEQETRQHYRRHGDCYTRFLFRGVAPFAPAALWLPLARAAMTPAPLRGRTSRARGGSAASWAPARPCSKHAWAPGRSRGGPAQRHTGFLEASARPLSHPNVQ